MDYTLEQIELNPYLIRFDTNQTEEKCIEAVRANWTTLQYITNQTYNVCKVAMQSHGDALQYVQNKTSDICEDAINTNTYAFRFVPDQIIVLWKSDKKYNYLLEKNGYIKYGNPSEDEQLCAIAHSPENVLHYRRHYGSDFFIKAVRANPKCILLLQSIESLPSSLYELAVKLDVTLFEKLNVQPPQTYKYALNSYGWDAFKRMCKVHNNEMYFVGLQADASLWRFIECQHLERNVDLGMDLNPAIIKYLEPTSLNYEKCLRAVRHSWQYIQYTPDKYQTEELCHIAINQCGDAMTLITDQTPALCNYVKAMYANHDLYIRKPKEVPAPANDQPAPAAQQPAPVEKQPAPAAQQPAPVEKQPAPVEKQPLRADPVLIENVVVTPTDFAPKESASVNAAVPEHQIDSTNRRIDVILNAQISNDDKIKLLQVLLKTH